MIFGCEINFMKVYISPFSHRMIAAVRYTYLKPKLLSIGCPPCSVMENILQNESGDVSIKKISSLLNEKQVVSDGKNEVAEVALDRSADDGVAETSC